MSVFMVDKTLDAIHSTADYSVPHTAIQWAIDQFRLGYDKSDPDRATIDSIVVTARSDDGFDINIVAVYEHNRQLYEGTCLPTGQKQDITPTVLMFSHLKAIEDDLKALQHDHKMLDEAWSGIDDRITQLEGADYQDATGVEFIVRDVIKEIINENEGEFDQGVRLVVGRAFGAMV